MDEPLKLDRIGHDQAMASTGNDTLLLPLLQANDPAITVVTVFDKNFNRVAQSPPLSQTEWTLALPLARGGTFLWEVTTTVDGNTITVSAAPAPRAQFRVVEAEKLAALTKLQQQQPASHLALGLGYARLGLLNDGEREFRQLVNENPDSAIARKLLRTVQMWHNSKKWLNE
jgi:hypothetical protein